ncbi:mCG54250, partial [Mus musculus]
PIPSPILESLFKWFQQQVNQIEEIGKDSLQKDRPSDVKFVKKNITQIARLMHKIEHIRGRLRERNLSTQSKKMDKEIPPELIKSYGLVEKQIEEFITSHSALESQTETESQPGTPSSMANRVTMMMKIFENQTAMLHKALNDQHTIESKYKQMETNYENLILKKNLLEGEIQRLRDPERVKSATKEERTKKPGKSEKKKDKDLERNISPNREFKSFEELHQIQNGARVRINQRLRLKIQRIPYQRRVTHSWVNKGRIRSHLIKVKGQLVKEPNRICEVLWKPLNLPRVDGSRGRFHLSKYMALLAIKNILL